MCALSCAEQESMILYTDFSITSADLDSFERGSLIFLQLRRFVKDPLNFLIEGLHAAAA